MGEPKLYMDIGHYPDHEHSAIWTMQFDGKGSPVIESVSARKRTHETTWGQAALNYWRGRFDTKTKQCSVQPPVLVKGDAPPVLSGLLRYEFGEGIEIWMFDPARRIQ